MTKKGFSIAEALMVLLIMSIIVAVSIPVITKKSRVKPVKTEAGLWKDYKYQFLMPVDRRDIALGDEKRDKGIRITGKLSLKDLSGVEIGWIKDSGTVSIPALEIKERLAITNSEGEEVAWIDDKGKSSFGEIPPGMMMTFVGRNKCPDGWRLSDGGFVNTQYGTEMTPDFTSLLSQISEAQGESPNLSMCVKCSPEQDCRYNFGKERRY